MLESWERTVSPVVWVFSSFQLAVQEAGEPAAGALIPREGSPEIWIARKMSQGAPAGNWSRGLHTCWVLWVTSAGLVARWRWWSVLQQCRDWIGGSSEDADLIWKEWRVSPVLYKPWCLWEQLIYEEKCAGCFCHLFFQWLLCVRTGWTSFWLIPST